jgi:subtilisin-like proprotein convertase family protein
MDVEDIDLAAYNGSNVRIRFWFHTDAATNSEGWYLDDLDVSRVSLCSAEVRRQSSAPTDGCPVGGPGSANGVIEPGENVALAITAANLGIAPATNLSATLTTTSPGVTITNGSVAYPNIPAGGSASGLGPFGFTLASGTTCGSTLDFNVRFQANEGAWSESFGLMIGAGGGFTRTYTATDVPKTINDLSTATSTMTIADTGTITDVNATVNVRHSFDGDLVITLVSPANTTVTLSNRRGSGGDNYTNTVFDDEAGTPISAGSPPYTGSFRPDSVLQALDGAALNGTWRLQVNDAANIDTGTLTAWSLTVTATTPPVCNSCVQGIPGEAGPISWSGKTDRRVAGEGRGELVQPLPRHARGPAQPEERGHRLLPRLPRVLARGTEQRRPDPADRIALLVHRDRRERKRRRFPGLRLVGTETDQSIRELSVRPRSAREPVRSRAA